MLATVDQQQRAITVEQLKAARGILEWTQEDLADQSGVSTPTIKRIELRKGEAKAETMAKLRRALEKAGVEFIPENGGGPGVRLKRKAKRSA